MLQLLKTCYLNGYFVLRLWFKLTHSASSAGSRKIAQKKEKEKDDFYVFLFLFEANEVVLALLCAIKFNIFDSKDRETEHGVSSPSTCTTRRMRNACKSSVVSN